MDLITDQTIPEIHAHIDGFSDDGEWLLGWAYRIGRAPTTIWLHSSTSLQPVPVLCDRPRSDLAALGCPKYCGFEIAIANLPEAWQQPGIIVRLCSDPYGQCPLKVNVMPLVLPPLINRKASFYAMDQTAYTDILPMRARMACHSLRQYGGFYRHWYFNQRRRASPSRLPVGYQPELIALCVGPLLNTPLNPYSDTCPTSWLQQTWKQPDVDIQSFKREKYSTDTSLSLTDLLWGGTNPYMPEMLLPCMRQRMIDDVLATSLKVSVILPTWNRRICVLRAIDSALQQTIAPLEILVADDGSDDGTVQAIKARFPYGIAEGSIRLLPDNHQGVSFARNRALSAARGDWFAYLDSDNAWHSDHLLILLYSAIYHPSSPAFLYSGRALYGPRVNGNRLPVKVFDYSELSKGNYIDLNCVLHHRSLYDKNGGFNIGLERLVDWDLALRYTSPAIKTITRSVNVCTVEYWTDPLILNNISIREDFLSARSKVLRLNNIPD